MQVGLAYDPMLAKVITWGADRRQAIERMKRALAELNVGGVRTGAPAALRVLEDERFVSGDFDTGLLAQMDLGKPVGAEDQVAAIAAALHRWNLARRAALSGGSSERAGWVARARARHSNHPWPLDGRGNERGDGRAVGGRAPR
jgi:acetyl/propionyl-CoA carboxylase alpha subunit